MILDCCWLSRKKKYLIIIIFCVGIWIKWSVGSIVILQTENKIQREKKVNMLNYKIAILSKKKFREFIKIRMWSGLRFPFVGHIFLRKKVICGYSLVSWHNVLYTFTWGLAWLEMSLKRILFVYYTPFFIISLFFPHLRCYDCMTDITIRNNVIKSYTRLLVLLWNGKFGWKICW